jgi:hypothetical protein
MAQATTKYAWQPDQGADLATPTIGGRAGFAGVAD